jgi:hypothetical protein
MTVGDFVGEGFELAAGATAVIRPGTSDHWIVHNIYIEDGKPCTVRRVSDSYDIPITIATGSLLAFSFHLDYDNYFELVNGATTTIYVSYDGVSVV